MWQFFDDRILFIPDNSARFAWQSFPVDTWDFDGEIITLTTPENSWKGYDDWVQQFSPEQEIELVRATIQKARENISYRGHIRGISLATSAELLREYYRDQGYEDSLAKNYTLPKTVQITASISLRHALWCEKDKRFLGTKDSQKNPYGMVTPPIRSSHDLRILQQALRMNILMGIEVMPGDEKYITLLVDNEIIPPFSVSQMIQFRWEKYVY